MTESLHLFEGIGVELEYMLVERDTLNVLPATDEILREIAGRYEAEVEVGDFSWSNELVLHVIEIKTNGPASGLKGLAAGFQADINRINTMADRIGGVLLPTAMHPWMDPPKDTKLWPHEYSPVYESFNRIFGCQGHGWSNLQSTHINLPFCGDDEFGRLHAAIRLVLPILPALAASSPIYEGRVAKDLDARLAFYRSNSTRVPEVTGRVIPEPAFSRADYDERIFDPLYAAIAPHDTDGIMRHQWLNARGAIARFDRGAIEIRLLDIQECAQADLAILHLIVAVLHGLIDERWCSFERQKAWAIEPLAAMLNAAIVDADETPLREFPEFVEMFGAEPARVATMADLWRQLFEQTLADDPESADEVAPLSVLLNHGTLARRIIKATGPSPDHERLLEVYRRLAQCLAGGEMFLA